MKRKTGFTLIELLVVVAVMALLSGGAVVAYNNFQISQKLLATKNEIESDLLLARSKAMSLTATDSGTGEPVLVAVDIASGVLRVRDVAGNVYFTKTVNQDDVVVADVATWTLNFGQYTGKLVKKVNGNFVPSDVAVMITISSPEIPGKTETVTVTPLGQIDGQ